MGKVESSPTQPDEAVIKSLFTRESVNTAIKHHQAYVDGGKTNHSLLIQAIEELLPHVEGSEPSWSEARLVRAHLQELISWLSRGAVSNWEVVNTAIMDLNREANKTPLSPELLNLRKLADDARKRAVDIKRSLSA